MVYETRFNHVLAFNDFNARFILHHAILSIQLFNQVSLKRGSNIFRTSFSNCSFKGSVAHSMFLMTDDARVVLNRVVATRGFDSEYWIASFSMLSPLSLQKSAAFLHKIFNCSGAGCHSGAPRSVSNPIEKGDALITPT